MIRSKKKKKMVLMERDSAIVTVRRLRFPCFLASISVFSCYSNGRQVEMTKVTLSTLDFLYKSFGFYCTICGPDVNGRA